MLLEIDVSGIKEKFNIGIYCGAKDNFFCIFIGSDLHSYTKFPVVRVKDFTLIPFLQEEFGSYTISHLFRKRLICKKKSSERAMTYGTGQMADLVCLSTKP